MEKRQTTYIITFLVLLTLIAVTLWTSRGHIDRALIGKEIVVYRSMVDGSKTENAFVAIPYLRNSDDYTFANIIVDLNRDGKFATYEVDGKTQEEWVVQNMPARILSEEGNGFAFILVDPMLEERKDFPLVAMLTRREQTAWTGGEVKNSAIQTIVISAVQLDEVRPRFKPDPTGLRVGGLPFDPLAPSITYAQDHEIPDVPPRNALLEDWNIADPTPPPPTGPIPDAFNVYRQGVPDIFQGNNECVPTSAANSLLWLANKYNFEDRMPRTTAALIQELKTDMLWAPDGVVTATDFLPGKRAFTARHNIPIESHQVGGIFDPEIVPKIAAELNRGQDVEIALEYGLYRSDGTYVREGGHMVTVVGAAEYGSGRYALDFHDPLSPGPNQLDIYGVDETRVRNYRYQGNTVTYIREAYAESPVSQPSATTAPETPQFTVQPIDFVFFHQIGTTTCPTPIDRVEITSEEELEWEAEDEDIPIWLTLSDETGTSTTTPTYITLEFNCTLISYVSQDLSADIDIKFTKNGKLIGKKTVIVKGKIQK